MLAVYINNTCCTVCMCKMILCFFFCGMHCLCVNNRIPIYTLKNYWSIQTAGALVNFYMPPVMLARSGELVVCLLILQISIHITVDLSTSNDIIMVPMPMQIHQHSLIQCLHNSIHLQGTYLAEYV